MLSSAKKECHVCLNNSATFRFTTSQFFWQVHLQHLSQRTGLCFACGKPGHWRASFPNLQFNGPSNTGQHSKLLSSEVDLGQDFIHEDQSTSTDKLIFLRVTGDSCKLKSADDCLFVKGRLCGALKFWNDICAPHSWRYWIWLQIATSSNSSTFCSQK